MKGNKGFYLSALILLWISIILSFTCDWATVRSGFVGHNSSAIDIDSNLGPALPVLGAVSGLLYLLVADSILVKSYFIWEY